MFVAFELSVLITVISQYTHLRCLSFSFDEDILYVKLKGTITLFEIGQVLQLVPVFPVIRHMKKLIALKLFACH